MIDILLTPNSVEGNPGPNLYWRGAPEDYLRLLSVLHGLGVSEGREVHLSACGFVQFSEVSEIICRSSRDGETLLGIDRDRCVIDLPAHLWRQILVQILVISFGTGHVYVEFDDLDLREDALIIMSSEYVSQVFD